MNLKVRSVSGSNYSALDRIEIILDADNQDLASVAYTIEVVSGVGVTHGGGGKPGQYLNYRSAAAKDYSDVVMEVTQDVMGSSSIKIECALITKVDMDAFNSEIESFRERSAAAGATEDNPNGTDGTFTEVPPTELVPDETVLISGEVQLEWTEDTYV